ncbi:MAG: WYL domain-containing protein [Frankiaceae bacterium]|jgi:proteasome accessory factor C|nr:WYL domain-containing protein [Frankiaceae bacterium]
MSSTGDRVNRLLTLVPYLVANDGASMAAVAAEFAITEAQLRRDLDLLWMCGLPGHGPGDLIDLSFTDDAVSVLFDAGMTRPLRLSPDEALAVVVALRTLADLTGLVEREAVDQALAKVELAAGGLDPDADTVRIDLGEEAAGARLQAAVATGAALRLRYFVPSRAQSTVRVVDPLRLLQAHGHTYLEAWCRLAEGLRLFRADRIDEIEVLAEPAAVPEGIVTRDVTGGVYAPADDHLLVTLELTPPYWWVADYYPCESVREHGEARRVALRVADPAWVRALCLGSGDQARVLAPGWLSEDIAAAARAALGAYRQ